MSLQGISACSEGLVRGLVYDRPEAKKKNPIPEIQFHDLKFIVQFGQLMAEYRVILYVPPKCFQVKRRRFIDLGTVYVPVVVYPHGVTPPSRREKITSSLDGKHLSHPSSLGTYIFDDLKSETKK